VASERNSTLVMPVPVELLRFFERMAPASAPAAPPPEDTGDAEVAEAETAIEDGPSAAGPDAIPPVEAVAIPPVEAIAIPPVEAPDIKIPEITADAEQPERP
ncbi:MAG TPA: hypothetical protein VMV17_08405, partial [Streptosporangiaceae bacterium]|nr:hypothetical protein [Streptosporangiaceae bacterium]